VLDHGVQVVADGVDKALKCFLLVDDLSCMMEVFFLVSMSGINSGKDT
jgi:hypothetical protein